MTYPASLLPHLLVGWQKVADRYKMPIYVFQTGDTYHAVSNEAQGLGHLVDTLAPQMLVSEQVAWPKSGVIIARRQGGEPRVAVGKMGKGIREQETADRAREGQKPGNMIAYSSEQIISRADAAGQAAYAAVIRAGGAAGVAERAYSRAYLGTIPPCWVALLASPIQPRRPKSGDGGIGVHAHGRVSGQSAVESAA
jgi:hypothetical protein